MEADIMRILSQEPNTGDDLCKMLGAEPEAFRAAARSLWIDGLIQGELADGCCSAPCGTQCVSAMKMSRVWQLSKKGRLRFKVMAAKGELI